MLDSYKASRNTTYCILIFATCYILLLIRASAPPSAFDSYWHLQMGKDLLENGLSPWIDHYSFTFYGKEISSIPIVFQVTLASFVSFFGENNGFYFIKAFYLTLFMFFLYLFFRQIKASWYIVFLILPFITYFVTLRLIVRPEIFSNILMIISLSLYLRARDSFSTKELLSICLLLLFWVNYHSPIFGYIIIFGLFLDRAIHKLANNDCDHSWTQWLIWGCIIFLIGFVNPSGEHFFINTLSMLDSEFGKYTSEYRPSYPFYSLNKIVYLAWILSIYTMIMSLIKKQYGFAFISLFLAYFSWTTTRLVAPVAIINFCILGYLLSQLSYSEFFLKLKPLIRHALLLLFIFLPLMVSYNLTVSTRSIINNHGNRDKILEKTYPVQVVDYLKNYQTGGNILNAMGLGGYLINKLSPDFKVYIDGRTNILYPIEHLKSAVLIEMPKYNRKNIVDLEALNKALDNYDVQYAVYKNTPEMLLMFYGTEKLNINFADENFLLFSKSKEIAFPVSSQLTVFPMCWNDKLSTAIEKEIYLSDTLFSEKSYTLKSLLSFLKGYLSQHDKSHYLDSLQPASLSDTTLRLAGYMALNRQEYRVAFKYFSSIQKQKDYDLLMSAYIFIKTDDITMAENMLHYFRTKNKFPKTIILPYETIAIFKHLLEIINAKNKLTKFLPSYIDDLEAILKHGNYSDGTTLKSVIPYQHACDLFR